MYTYVEENNHIGIMERLLSTNAVVEVGAKVQIAQYVDVYTFFS